MPADSWANLHTICGTHANSYQQTSAINIVSSEYWIACFWTLRFRRTQALPALCRRNLKTEVSLWKRIKCFPSTLRRRNLKTQQSPVILDLCLRKLSQGNHMIIVTSSFSKSSIFKTVFEKLRFGDGLVWTAGLTVEIKLRFQTSGVVRTESIPPQQ